MDIIFSVIIPVFNVAPYLCECLDSILAQTFKEWEAICVDDGSTDGSSGILDEYAAKDSRFKVIHQKNAGVSIARNVGLENVNGRYFLFVDADDIIAPWSFAAFHSFFRKYNCAGVVASGKWHMFKSSAALNSYKEDFSIRYQREEYLFRISSDRIDLLCGENAATGCVCGRVFSASKFADLRFAPNVAIMEDMRFWVDALSRPAIWGEFDLPYYYYRQRESSASHNVTLQGCIEVFDGHKYVVSRLNENTDITMSQWRGYWRHYSGYFYLVWRKMIEDWPSTAFEIRKHIIDILLYCAKESGLSLPLSFPIMCRMPDGFSATWLFKVISIIDRVSYSVKWRSDRWAMRMRQL